MSAACMRGVSRAFLVPVGLWAPGNDVPKFATKRWHKCLWFLVRGLWIHHDEYISICGQTDQGVLGQIKYRQRILDTVYYVANINDLYVLCTDYKVTLHESQVLNRQWNKKITVSSRGSIAWRVWPGSDARGIRHVSGRDHTCRADDHALSSPALLIWWRRDVRIFGGRTEFGGGHDIYYY